MKKHSFIAEITFFSIIFIFFVLPPLFYSLYNNNISFSNWTFPWQNLLTALFATFLLIFYDDEKFSFTKLLPAILVLGLLFFVSLVFKIIDMIFIKAQEQITTELPHDFAGWLFCILGFLFSSFYEEVLYRFYLPESLNVFFDKYQKKIIVVICEILTALLFAFAHLYLGILSVLNAFIAHIILRLSFKKTKGIWSGFIAHFVYNVISLILL